MVAVRFLKSTNINDASGDIGVQPRQCSGTPCVPDPRPDPASRALPFGGAEPVAGHGHGEGVGGGQVGGEGVEDGSVGADVNDGEAAALRIQRRHLRLVILGSRGDTTVRWRLKDQVRELL